MFSSQTRPTAGRRVSAVLASVLAFGVLSGAAAQAQDGSPQAEDGARPHKAHHVRPIRTAEARPLTVRRRAGALIAGDPLPVESGYYDGTGLFRSWDDPRLTTFYGWRLGGDNFYGDTRGDTITRGNAGLGMIAGYGGARGGYGGPHFDSVGGFHNGPGPEAQESADYATGNIWQPVYDRPMPRYPSLKQQVAQLDTGLSGTGQVSRVKSSRERWMETARSTTAGLPSSPVPDDDDDDFDIGF